MRQGVLSLLYVCTIHLNPKSKHFGARVTCVTRSTGLRMHINTCTRRHTPIKYQPEDDETEHSSYKYLQSYPRMVDVMFSCLWRIRLAMPVLRTLLVQSRCVQHFHVIGDVAYLGNNSVGSDCFVIGRNRLWPAALHDLAHNAFSKLTCNLSFT